ncbi:endoribonuclease Dicer-like isoform X2 [Planococcus citri]|uniref:endoribonuclease Dicer-like isoform X2 n=1 Tax=Planococcus citri TaxID=170843 RepID=UPI0031F763DB
MDSDSGDTTPTPTEFERRQYQVELIEKIKQMNAILFLPTGSGKTFIALEIIKHMQNDLQKPVSEGGKRTIFLVNTIQLVEQHYSFLKRHCSLNITMLTGDAGVDLWKEKEWTAIESNAQILIMTSQIYVNVLTHAYLYLKNANLIIFDECHHAVHKHPMKEVMKFFDLCEEEQDLPKVLGLSATLLNANTTVLQFSDQLRTLENTFRSKIITSTRVAEVKRFSTKAKEKFEILAPYKSPSTITQQIDDLIRKHIDILKNLKLKDVVDIPEASDVLMNDRGENRVKLLRNCLNDLMVHLEEFGTYLCYIGCELYIVQLYRIMFEKSNDELYCNALMLMITLVKAIKKILSIEISRSGDLDTIEAVKKNSSDKLIHLLKEIEKLGPTDKCIVFVERRMTAKILTKIIEMFFKETKSQLVADFMIGFSVHPLRNSRESEFVRRCNKKVMTNFRSGKINILVASNVLEEGIDMPDCNAVFMYDFPKTFRSYVQSKGRARKEESTYILLADKDLEKNRKNIVDFKKLEKELEHVVHTFDISHDSDDEDKSDKENDDEVYTTEAGASVTKAQAIPIVNLYCSTLPSDVFTQLTPYWWKNESEDGCYCKLQFPMNAAIKEIIKGPVCKNKKEAKQAVAFEAVKMLHEMNALNDKLMPILAPDRAEDEKEWFPNWDNSFESAAGTKSSKREFDMQIPKYLQDCRPIPNEKCYLHVINMIPKYPIPSMRRRERCHILLTSRYELGIITRHKIPQICNFPVFSDLGEVEISIDTNHCALELNEEELLGISKFHRVLFLKAVQVVKKCLMYSEDSDSVGYFLVPLKPCKEKSDKMEIAFRVVFDQWNIFDVNEPSEEERKNERFTKEEYWGNVVVPWYQRPDFQNNDTIKKRYYVITDFDNNYNLLSPFPNERYETFAQFFEKVYNLKSLRPGQPMMEARPIPHNLDCLRPRVTSTDKSEKSRSKEQSVFMAPEFVTKQTFPSCYWYKSTVVPTILHRLHYLLVAEEVREKIVTEAEIGKLEWEKDENDVLRVNDKYTIKKSSNNQKQPVPSKDENKTNESKISKKKSGGYSRRIEKLRKAEKCLIKLLENEEDLPIDLDRSKNVTTKDIKKFLTISRNTRFYPQIKRVPSSSISASLVNYEEPPMLLTLQERVDYAGPRQKEIFEALTPAGCNDIVDLERLETLGDSFLKFAVSFTIFVCFNNVNEGYLTTLKGRLVGNRNLLYCGNKLNIGPLIKVNTFSSNLNWCPPGFVLPEILFDIREIASPSVIFHVKIPYSEQFSGSISMNTVSVMKADVKEFIDNAANKPETTKQEGAALSFYGKQSVSDKCIADVVEALIGVYVKTGGIKPAYRLLNYLGILAKPKYEDIMGTQVPSPLFEKSRLTVDDLVPNWKKLEQLLSYEFRDKSYIVQALSHPSYLKNNMTDCYQTLEFIGDAVIDFLITSYIYQYCGNLPPGKLTDLRASLVNNNTFGALCVRLGLHKFLLSNNKKLIDAINRFIEYQEERNYEIHGNEMMVLISESDVKVAEEVEVPKVLGDLFESIAGAIYLDSGNDLKTVWRIYYNIMKEEIQKFSENIPINPIRALYEEPGLKVKFLKETTKTTEDVKLRKFIAGKIEVPLSVIKGGEEYLYYGRGENSDLCRRAAAKLALRDFGRTEFVI